MDTTRRGFFGLLVSAVTAGVAVAVGKRSLPRAIWVDELPFIQKNENGYVTAATVEQYNAKFLSTYHQKFVAADLERIYRLRG